MTRIVVVEINQCWHGWRWEVISEHGGSGGCVATEATALCEISRCFAEVFRA